MSVSLSDPSGSLGETLRRTIGSIREPKLTLRTLLEMIGEQGLLLICALLCVPFLIPVSIPGVSTVFGLAIILFAVGITANRVPWLPRRVMDREIDAAGLKSVLERGLRIVERIETFIRPRLTVLTRGAFVNRLNGLGVIAGGVLLMAPLGLIPFSNTLPAAGILLLTIGMAQRDGLFVLAGYALLVATVVYFAVLFWLAVMAGTSAAQFLSS